MIGCLCPLPADQRREEENPITSKDGKTLRIFSCDFTQVDSAGALVTAFKSLLLLQTTTTAVAFDFSFLPTDPYM